MNTRRNIVSAIIYATFSSCAAYSTAVIRNTTLGSVQGLSNGNVSAFLSIPFAAPPLGEYRFRAPQPGIKWDGVKDVTLEPNDCPQFKVNATSFRGSEDCLYLHVWQPDNVPIGTLLPVMFWIYGGAYVFGTSDKGSYDGANLANDLNVVVVAANYRLGILGFAALDSLRAEDPDNSTGNAALQDQTAALRWTQANAAYFGGDATRVHLFGQSAGGFSVAWHMVSPASAGLFASATMESGSTDATEFFMPLDDAVAFTELFGSSCGSCNKTHMLPVNHRAASAANGVPQSAPPDPLLACLRSLPTADLLKTLEDALNPNWPWTGQHWTGRQPPLTFGPGIEPPALAPFLPWGPAIDGSTAGLLGMPLDLIRAGQYNRVPFMLGTNKDDGSIFAPALYFIVPNVSLPLTDTGIGRMILHVLNAYNTTELALLLPTIMAAYPISDFPRGEWAKASAIVTDFFFACSARRTARALTGFGTPVWLYQFSYNLSGHEGGGSDYGLLGDHHSIEIPFVFRNEAPLNKWHFDANDWLLSDAMSSFWTNLARAGDPNAGWEGLHWPSYVNSSDVNFQFEMPLSTTAQLKEARCDMWDSVLATLQATRTPR